MNVAQWWSKRSRLEQALMIGIPGVSIGVLTGMAIRKIAMPQHPGYTPIGELPNLLDFDDEVNVPEPDGIEYDEYDAPCIELEAPVSSGLEGNDVEFCTPPAELEPIGATSVAYAAGGERPAWPLDTSAKRKLQVSYQDVRKKWHGRWGRHFGAPRAGKAGERVHVGIDMFADPGDVILATESGEILATLPFYKGTGALYLLTDSGVIVNYGEIEKGSWTKYGIKSGIGHGQRVKAGQKLGAVGLSSDGSHMLHLEAYDPSVTIDQIRQGKMQWPKDQDPPEGILDPTRYLVRAQRVRYEKMVHEV